MRKTIQHPVYGEIVYTENAWTGKKSLTINGIAATPITKKVFKIDDKSVTIIGNDLMGASLFIDGEIISLSPKPKWYEFVLAILPLAFLLTWGNSVTLCSIFPVVGGAIGGALGGAASIISLCLMKKSKSPIIKVIIGIGALVATALIAFALALVITLLII